jgi:hypothetical protein
MTKPANSKDQPSPSDEPTFPPEDKGGKAVVGSDGNYTKHKLETNNIAVKREREEHPVEPIKDPPKEKGVDKGQVQP